MAICRTPRGMWGVVSYSARPGALRRVSEAQSEGLKRMKSRTTSDGSSAERAEYNCHLAPQAQIEHGLWPGNARTTSAKYRAQRLRSSLRRNGLGGTNFVFYRLS